MNKHCICRWRTFSTSYLENSEGEFILRRLPTSAQFGPTRSFLIDDMNKDGHWDIIGAGSIFDAEAETIRYDAIGGTYFLGMERVISTIYL